MRGNLCVCPCSGAVFCYIFVCELAFASEGEWGGARVIMICLSFALTRVHNSVPGSELMRDL